MVDLGHGQEERQFEDQEAGLGARANQSRPQPHDAGRDRAGAPQEAVNSAQVTLAPTERCASRRIFSPFDSAE